MGGHCPGDPDSLALVPGSHGGSRQHVPPSIKPDLGQVEQNSSQSEPNKVGGVFHEHEARSNLAKYSGKLPPQTGTLAVDSLLLSGRGNVLAWKPPAYGELAGMGRSHAKAEAHSGLSARKVRTSSQIAIPGHRRERTRRGYSSISTAQTGSTPA